MRKCVGCGEMKPKKELMRILKTESGEFIVDAAGKKNGRGAYIWPLAGMFKSAVKSRGLERSFKQEIPQDVYDSLEKEMGEIEKRDKILSLIGLATKAGRCISGETMTESETKSGKAKLVIVASDASENTKKKFQDMCKFYKVPICIYGDKDTLGHAMGKEFRASLAILDEGFADGIRKSLTIERILHKEVVDMTKMRVHELAKEAGDGK